MGATLNTIGALLAAALTVATVTTGGGSLPMPIIGGLLAIGLALRAIGDAIAASKERWSMPWGARIASWVFIGLAVAALALATTSIAFAAFGAFVVLDALGGRVHREAKARAEKAPRSRRNLWITVGIVIYLIVVATFHALVGQYYSYGVLTTWSLLALGFCVLAVLVVDGPRAGEAWLRPPFDHRLHERRDARVVDPHRARAERVLQTFIARGDAGPFLELVREAARAADLPEADALALEERIIKSFSRAGTHREQDARAALDEVEAYLMLRTRAT